MYAGINIPHPRSIANRKSHIFFQRSLMRPPRTAILLISQYGIEGLTTKALAGAVGISEPALYRHFPGKGEIIRAMITHFDSGVESLQITQSSWQFIKDFLPTASIRS